MTMSNPNTTSGTTIVTNEMMSNPPVRSPVRMIESRIPKIDSIESMPTSGVSAKAAKKVVYRDLKGDSNPQANLASFVCTEMEQEAEEILLDGMKKNFIDLEQYPGSGLVEKKCIQIIGGLWNAPAAVKARKNARTDTNSGTTETNSGANFDNTNSGATNLDTTNLTTDTKVVGTSCLGSSEAIMLAGLAMRSKWRTRREKEGKDTAKPNMVFGSNVQVCWHKMCRYFDIECREANVYGNIDSPEDSKLILTAEQIKFENLIDENTIGVCPILGSTYNGEYEDVKGIHDMVVEINEKTGWNIPLHIDAASGGFIAPFLEPELVWDFRLPNVKSINASGHKFGLTYAGLGWLLFREEKDLPKDLCFSVSYLGGNQESFTLNFSKPASAILAQYYNFIRLGFEGYKEVMSESMSTANYLRQALKKLHCPIADSTSTTARSDESTTRSDESTSRMMMDDSTSAVSTTDSVSRKNIPRVHIVDKQHMPLVSWSLSKEQQKYCTVFELSDRLQKKGGWSVPAYSCSAGAEGLDIMRVVVKNSFSMVMCDLLVKDILDSFQFFDERYQKRQMMESQSMESNILTHMSTINEDQIYLPASAENTITSEILKKFNKDSKKKMQVSGSKSGVDSLFSDSNNNETTENEAMDTMDAIEKMDTPVKSSSSSSSKAVTETTINVVQNKRTISNAAEQGLAMFMSMLALFFAMLSSFFMWSSNMTTLIKEYCEEHSGVKTEKSTLERKSSESKKTFGKTTTKNLIAGKEVLVDDDSEENSTIDDNESDKKHTEEEQSTAEEQSTTIIQSATVMPKKTAVMDNRISNNPIQNITNLNETIAKVREAKKPSLDFQAREISTSRRNPCNPTKKLGSPGRLGSIKKISSSSSSRALSTTVSTTASSNELLNSSNHNLLDDSDEDLLDSAHTFAYLASQRNIILPTN